MLVFSLLPALASYDMVERLPTEPPEVRGFAVTVLLLVTVRGLPGLCKPKNCFE